MGNRPPRTLISLAACIAASILLCLPILNASLVSDDWVLLDAIVHKGVWAAWGGGGHEMLGFFRPLITLTLWLNYQIGGLNPLGYHLFNAVVHGICAWLVGVVAFLFLRNAAPRHQGSGLIPALASLIFLVHPSHAEPVAWVSARGDLMACAFGLAAFALWIHSPKISNSILAGMCLIAALLAKESAIVVPVFLFAFELIVAGRGTRGERVGHALRRTWPLFLILIIFMVIRAMALGHAVGGYGSGRIFAVSPLFWARNFGAASIRSFLPVIPAPGHADFYWDLFSCFTLLLALAIGIAIVVVVARKTGKRTHAAIGPMAFLLIAFLISLIPVINLPLSIQLSEGERFIYLPSAFTSIALAMLLGFFFPPRWKYVLGVQVLILYLIGLQIELGIWRTAGGLAGKLLGDFQRITNSRQIEQVDVFNLPDHLRGAYVFRNGFVEAARLNGVTAERVKTIEVHGLKRLWDINEPYKPDENDLQAGHIQVYYSSGSLTEYSL